MWLIIIALAIGLIYASLLYLFSKKYSKGLTALLFALRTIVVATVVMLFINPYIKQRINKIEQPIIVFAQDNSESIVLTKDSVFYKEKYPKLIDSVVNVLEKDYDVETYCFDEGFLTAFEMTNTGQYTNISKAFNTIQRQYYKKNVGAVVLLSDGIVNQGVNPELNIEKYPFPIYTVTLGDTVSYPRMSISDVKYNKTVQANMFFPLRVTANALNYKGKEMNIVVKMDGNEVENATVSVNSNRLSKTFDFNIDSGDDGVKNIEIFLTPVETQGRVSLQTTAMRRIFINVTDKKYRILCIAKAPHPDIATIKSALDDHYEFETCYFNGNNNDNDVKTRLIASLRDQDLVILHQSISETFQETSLPKLMIIGPGTDFDAFNQSQKMVTIKHGATNTNLDVRGRFNNGFGLFTINSDIKNEIQSYPPLSLPHSEIAFNNQYNELLRMEIMDLETPYPLMAFANDNDGNKNAFIFGTGCWRWKLYEYFHHKNHDGFNEIFSKTIKYLLTEKDKELTVNHKDNYLNTEQINISAELRNPSMELVNEPDLYITISQKTTSRDVRPHVSTTASSYDYVFSKGENNYNLNIGMLPEGIYKYHAHASLGGIEYNADGTFTVEATGIEAQDLTADIERMRSLASQTGGRHYYITEIQQLTIDLQKDERITSISRQETRYDDLINLKWLFFSILALITTEWLLRKIFGIY